MSRDSIDCAAWGFRWLYNQPEVSVALSGMNEMVQLEGNIRLPDEAKHASPCFCAVS